MINFTEPLILKNEENDKLSLTISDDLSELLLLKSSIGCGEETRR